MSTLKTPTNKLEIEEQADICPICGGIVVSFWVPGKGCLPNPNYYLLADYIVHSECFDEIVEATWNTKPKPM